MFNALSTEQLLVGVGRVLRMNASAEGELEDYQRSQTLSAYSVTRLLAAEQAAAGELLGWAREELLMLLAGDQRPPVAAAREAIADAPGGVELGRALSELLRELGRADLLRPRLHRLLAELADREVDALARVPE